MTLLRKKCLPGLLFIFTLPFLLPAPPAAADALYSANNNSSVSIIDTSNDTLTDTVYLPFSSEPTAICLNAVSPHAYTLNSGDNTVSVIDTKNKAVINTITDSRFTGLTALACDPTGTRILIGNNDISGTASNILYLNTATHALDSQETAVGNNPGSIVFNKNGSKAYVLNRGTPSISVIDTSTKLVDSTTQLLDSNAPYALAIHTLDTYLYVVNALGNAVTFINPATMEIDPSPPLISGMFSIVLAVSNATNILYVSDSNNTIFLVDPILKSVTPYSIESPLALVERNDGQRIYVATYDNIIRSYDVASLSSPPATIPLPSSSSPQGLATLQGTRHNLGLNITGNGSGSVNWPFNQVYPQSTSEIMGVPEGIGVTVNATAGTCSKVDWMGCDSVSGGGTPSAFCTVNPFAVDKYVNAIFTKNIHSVATSVSGGTGVISCTTPICDGGNTLCSITPATGYLLTSLTDNGKDIYGNVTGGVQILNIVANHEITAGFTLIPFTVSTSAGTNGSVYPNTAQTIPYGNTANFTLTPNTGFHIVTPVAGSCGGTLSGTTYTTAAITANCTVVASFALNSYSVTPSTGSNGGIFPSVPQIATHGATTSFTLSPDSGYSIVSVTGCNGSLSGNLYTTGAIIGDCSVSATYVVNTFTVSTTVTDGSGTIICNSPVSNASTAACTITPAIGYQLVSLLDNSDSVFGSVDGGTIYTVSSVTFDHSIQATFSLIQYTVTPSAVANGSISPAVGQPVSYGSAASFTLIPDTGYHIAPVTGSCGGTLSGTTYTTAAITANCTVTVEFVPNQYTVSATNITGGNITPATTLAQHGSTATFSVTSVSGYYAGSVNGCGGKLSGNIYTTGNITGDCSISAIFVALPVVTASALTSNGSVICTKPAVSGENITCLITPDKGYHLSTMTDNGVNILPSVTNKNSYSLNGITSSHTINASFAAYSLADALQALRYAVRIELPKPDKYLWLDVAPLDSDKPKGNGVIDIMDALVLLKHSIDSYTAW